MIGIIKNTLWVLLVYIWFDTIHGVQSGIIRGLGRQAYGSIYTLICYYVIGMPLALVLAFNAELGITGLWLGFSIACVILDVGFCMIISCPDWSKIATQMRTNIEAGKTCRTPEVSNYRRNFTPKNNRSQCDISYNQINKNDIEPVFGNGPINDTSINNIR